MLLLEQDTTGKRWVDKKVKLMEFDTGDDRKKYKAEVIGESAVYARESESGYLLGLYYLVSWKRYLEKENT